MEFRVLIFKALCFGLRFLELKFPGFRVLGFQVDVEGSRVEGLGLKVFGLRGGEAEARKAAWQLSNQLGLQLGRHLKPTSFSYVGHVCATESSRLKFSFLPS